MKWYREKWGSKKKTVTKTVILNFILLQTRKSKREQYLHCKICEIILIHYWVSNLLIFVYLSFIHLTNWLLSIFDETKYNKKRTKDVGRHIKRKVSYSLFIFIASTILIPQSTTLTALFSDGYIRDGESCIPSNHCPNGRYACAKHARCKLVSSALNYVCEAEEGYQCEHYLRFHFLWDSVSDLLF